MKPRSVSPLSAARQAWFGQTMRLVHPFPTAIPFEGPRNTPVVRKPAAGSMASGHGVRGTVADVPRWQPLAGNYVWRVRLAGEALGRLIRRAEDDTWRLLQLQDLSDAQMDALEEACPLGDDDANSDRKSRIHAELRSDVGATVFTLEGASVQRGATFDDRRLLGRFAMRLRRCARAP